MNRKKPRSPVRISLLIVISTFVSLPGSVRGETPVLDVRGRPTVNNFSRYGDVFIEFKKTVYNPGEEIPVKFHVRNRGYRAIRIYPSLIPNKTFQFLVIDRQGRELPIEFDRERSEKREHGERNVNLQGEDVKEIILHPGESYNKTIHLRDYFRFAPGKEYRIAGYFYPDFRRDYFVRSVNMARLRIAEDPDVRYFRRGEYEYFSDSVPELSAEETVFLFLSAEMRGNWKNCMKFLDLRKYIHSYDRFASKYVLASEADKPGILRQFEKFLMTRPDNRLRHFKIQKKEFDRNESGEIIETGRAYVTVRAERESRGYSVFFDYRFTLEKVTQREGFWKIIHVTANIVR